MRVLRRGSDTCLLQLNFVSFFLGGFPKGLRFCGVSLERWFRVGTHAWCHLFGVVPAKFKTGMCEMKNFGLKFVVYLGT